MYIYISMYGVQEQPVVNPKCCLEGLKLLVRHSHVQGIFAVSCLFMVGITIGDYTMKVLALQHFVNKQLPCEMGDSCYNNIASGVHGMSRAATVGMSCRAVDGPHVMRPTS
jgi:hypothetical protein